MNPNYAGRNGKEHTGKLCSGTSLLELLLSTSLAVILMMSMVVLYYSAAKTAAREENLSTASREARNVIRRLARDFRLVGLMAPQDVDGNANDINRDVPNQTWSDSTRDDFEYATTYELVYTSDIDNDGTTETVWLYLEGNELKQESWEWSRDSVRWREPSMRTLATNVDYLLLDYYDRLQARIPEPSGYPEGGFILDSGERRRVTTVEVIVVLRSAHEENADREYLTMPDGQTFYDKYRRTMHRFMIRGRNLSLGA